MTSAEQRLETIGFARRRGFPECWRVTRLDAPPAATTETASAPEPACSRPLLRWRDLLARDSGPSPYRISRIGG